MISIVVDSTAALTRAEARRLGATMVSSTYDVDGAPHAETFMGENGDYDALLVQERVSDTHSPTVSDFRQAFLEQVALGNDVLCITISSRLAGTYRNACKAADSIRPELGQHNLNVAVLDSLSGFSNTEYLARKARECIDKGMSFSQVTDELISAREKQGICFSVPSTEPLRSSGRLAMLPQSITTMLNRFPIFTMKDGAIACVDKARGSKALARMMVDQVPAGARDITLAHYGSRGPLIVELLQATRESFPGARIRVKDGGPVLSTNLGRGSVSIAWSPDIAEDESHAATSD